MKAWIIYIYKERNHLKLDYNGLDFEAFEHRYSVETMWWNMTLQST